VPFNESADIQATAAAHAIVQTVYNPQ
jgi:hypothetical protein